VVFRAAHVYTNPNTFNATFRLEDKEHGLSITETMPIDVVNIPPNISDVFSTAPEFENIGVTTVALVDNRGADLSSMTHMTYFVRGLSQCNNVTLRGNRWRSGALLATALALSLVALDLFAGLLSPKAMNMGVVTRTIPQWWPPPDPILGFRPKPDSEVIATAGARPASVRGVCAVIATASKGDAPAPSRARCACSRRLSQPSCVDLLPGVPLSM